MNKCFVSIGHITNDTEPAPHLGGAVSYAAIAAKNLGYESHIITKCPRNHPYITQLRNYGITVHELSTKLKTLSTHKNIYDLSGRKQENFWDIQESISQMDFDAFPKNVLQNAQILIAPVNDEVDEHLTQLLSRYGTVHVAPSGYFRKINNDRNVTYKKWSGFKNIRNVKTLILGDQDITFQGQIDINYLDKLKKFFPVIILTEGGKGSSISSKDDSFHISAFPLLASEIRDLAGAGDCYAAAFIAKFTKTGNYHESAVFASFFAAVKIAGLGGLGVDSVPTVQQLDKFKNERMSEVIQFLKINNAKADNLIL